ncbi:MAG TPA: hypothetical protein VHN79_02875 [Lacunisphaera sp.]|nr:hypothetical protein [Lacunisphaera sp.]
MSPRHLIRLASACLLLSVVSIAAEEEENLWPFLVRRSDPAAGTRASEMAGPLVFTRSGIVEQKGVRPLFMTSHADGVTEGNFIYPFFTWRNEAEYRTFSFFQLVNLRTDRPADGPVDERFDVWPFYFSRQAPDPAASYRAFFPLGGTIRNRFGRDRIHFTLFPLYSHTEKSGKHVTHAPWPFLRFIGGEGHHGFEFWPLYGRSARPGDYDRRFWLWPFGYRSVRNLSDPIPDLQVGVLPFYTRDTGPGYIRENYAWPFFGYTHRTEPYRYDERRYFWPFLVQGKGDDRLVNRWGPFYTHSVIKGTEKTWLLWPVYRNQRWEADGVAQEKDQVLFFLWWSLEQKSLANPAAAPARKTHLWPLLSAWDNGAGRRQVQALSPFEIFFPRNDTVRQLWTPLFALYRYDQQPDTSARHSLLWNAVTWKKTPDAREFRLGPLFSVHRNPDHHRVALGNGVIGMQRNAAGRWRLFLFDFKPKAAIKADQAPLP